MKNTHRSRSRAKDVDMPAEYQLDWSKAKPNPYAARLKDTVAVVLAPEVAEVFPTSESVNTLLRSVIAAVPPPGRRSTPRRRSRSRRSGLSTG
jgi:Na+-transporting NADH:ubiquinone oxidoreductase subunit NqrF